jgi:hypothetical protein
LAFSISDISANMQYGGARPSKFSALITNPIDASSDSKIPFLCKAASLPGKTLGVVNVGYFGRQVPLPGDTTFEPWTTTVYNDEDFAIRNTLEKWHAAINGNESNIAAVGSAPANYLSQGAVTQYDKSGNELRTYQFVGLWPSAIGPIELDWDNRDQIEVFQVTWQYAYWEIVSGITGTGDI